MCKFVTTNLCRQLIISQSETIIRSAFLLRGVHCAPYMSENYVRANETAQWLRGPASMMA